jgi:hypothetical protein
MSLRVGVPDGSLVNRLPNRRLVESLRTLKEILDT